MKAVVSEIEVRLLLEAVYVKFHHDFRGYSSMSLRRRLTVALGHFGCETVAALQDKLLHEPQTFPTLLQFLTVQVSDMFRDPTFFHAFRERVVPELRTYPSFRVWIAGCSSGEEVYSVAIVLRECGMYERALVYATDINPEALAKAEAGIFALDRMPGFAENYRLSGGRGALSDHYTAAYGSAAFDRSLRKNVVFSDHSLATDNVFAEVQVVLCRNVLIYFDKALQERAIALFEEALPRRGLLGLGSRETVQFSKRAESFRLLVPEERWYVRC